MIEAIEEGERKYILAFKVCHYRRMMKMDGKVYKWLGFLDYGTLKKTEAVLSIWKGQEPVNGEHTFAQWTYEENNWRESWGKNYWWRACLEYMAWIVNDMNFYSRRLRPNTCQSPSKLLT